MHVCTAHCTSLPTGRFCSQHALAVMLELSQLQACFCCCLATVGLMQTLHTMHTPSRQLQADPHRQTSLALHSAHVFFIHQNAHAPSVTKHDCLPGCPLPPIGLSAAGLLPFAHQQRFLLVLATLFHTSLPVRRLNICPFCVLLSTPDVKVGCLAAHQSHEISAIACPGQP